LELFENVIRIQFLRHSLCATRDDGRTEHWHLLLQSFTWTISTSHCQTSNGWSQWNYSRKIQEAGSPSVAQSVKSHWNGHNNDWICPKFMAVQRSLQDSQLHVKWQ